MKVSDSVDLGDGHVVEIGTRDEDSHETALRHRQANGNGHGHTAVEIPLGDVAPIVRAAAERDLLEASTATTLIELLAASVARRQSIRRARKVRLDELIAKITDENLHAEIDAGPPQGNEVW